MARFSPASVLESIKPTAKEQKEEKKFSAWLVRQVQNASPRGCKAVLTGSVAKGTYLRDSRDIDIFVLFPKKQEKSQFEHIIEQIVRKAFPKTGYQLSYAEHPYARLHIQGRRVDLVPAYMIRNAKERISAVDRSVLHTKYITRNMGQKLKDDVLLLKKLLKSNGLYGAEIKVEGFPGYLCELMVLRYKGFFRMINSVAKWNLPVVIDLKGHYSKNDTGALPLRFKKQLVAIDPTDANRNVAAALSQENLQRFISLCRRFRKNPSPAFFFRKPKAFGHKMKELASRGTAYTITLPKPDVVDDILWGQIKKLIHQLEMHLEKDGFELCARLIADDSGEAVRIGFSVRRPILPKTISLEGPLLDMGEHAVKFRERHKGAKFTERGGRVFAVEKRIIRKPEDSVIRFFANLAEKGKSHLAGPLSMVSIERQ